MAVITCQGGVTINNYYNCMLMFACTFYNGFRGKKKKNHIPQQTKVILFPLKAKGILLLTLATLHFIRNELIFAHTYLSY